MKNFIVGVFGVVMVALGCSCGGGGDDDPKPLGLFDTQNNNQISASISPEAQAVSGALATSDSIFEVAYFELDSFSSTSKATVNKAIDSRTGQNCTQVDAMNISCSETQHGPVSGDLNVTASLHYDEFSSAGKKGTFTLHYNFADFAFSQNICQRDVQIKGIFKCNLDFDGRSDNGNAIADVSGLCNTAESPDHTMQIWIGGKEHRVGYDLVLTLHTQLEGNTTKRFLLKNMAIDGTVSFDGVAYPYGSLKTVLSNECK